MISVIHNPNAKQNRKRPERAERLAEILDGVGTLHQTQSIEAVHDVARHCLETGCKVVGVNGGDGSLQMAMTIFANIYKDHTLPSFVVMRGGTMNTVAGGLGIKGTPESILSKVVKGLKGQGPLTRMKNQVLCANGHLGFMSGAAVVVRFLDAYYDAPSQGPVQAVKMGFRIAGSTLTGTDYAKEMFKPEPLIVEVDGEPLPETEFSIILGCTVEDISMGCRATPRAYERRGAFHFLACSLSPMQIVGQAPRLWTGREIPHPAMHHSAPVERVTIRSENGSVRWMLDGECRTDDRLDIKVWGEVELLW
ncbi:diacylglycerol/lipid kinase family protein [Desulfoluna spongiiphila]|uniref:Diacylglycerol kinase family enzyme n=1 Tax=Desulfoluna spongiiphila TaxID=419481 RepID=A0A1G5ABT2_9BACT|nr:diacylglycerol kinase family protein [Desulfoluna spongiiphila]SCX75335.1 Diacylglycerol kinase family enzyme [Desulfoluna spongiiphila]